MVQQVSRDPKERLALLASLPFFLVHVACLGALFLPVSPWLLGAAVVSYAVRMFAVTAGYHRYFSHRSFKTSRVFQLVLAFVAQTSLQKGVLWWAGHHRQHHRYSDSPEDVHSPVQRGFWWSHVGWFLCTRYDATPLENVKELVRYPELRWLDRRHFVPSALLGTVLFLAGGLPLLVWGFVIPTVLLWHGTFAINSLAHVVGTRRYDTPDDSRNSLWLALLTFGEGWHNNHHHYQSSVRQGFFRGEVDITYGVLKVLERLGLVWELREPPESAKIAHPNESRRTRTRYRDVPAAASPAARTQNVSGQNAPSL